MEFKLPINKYINTNIYLGLPLYSLSEFQDSKSAFSYTSREYRLYTAVMPNNDDYGLLEGTPSIMRDQYCSYMEMPELGIRLYPTQASCTFIILTYVKEYTYNQEDYFEATEERKAESLIPRYSGKSLSERGSELDEISSTLTRDIVAFNYPFPFYNLPTKFEVEMIEIHRDKLRAIPISGTQNSYDVIVDTDEPISINFQEIRNQNTTETLQHLYLLTQNIVYQEDHATDYLSSITPYELKYGDYSVTIEDKLKDIFNKYINGELDEELNQLDILNDSNLIEEIETGEEWPTDDVINNAIADFPNNLDTLGQDIHLNTYWNNI